MAEVVLKNERGFHWSHDNQVSHKGYSLTSVSIPESGRALVREISGGSPQSLIGSTLSGINGCFAFVVQNDRFLVAATDKQRSFPLYYIFSDGALIVSDDPVWLRDAHSSGNYCRDASAEFLMTGFVTGRDTLCSDIYQLQAGEFLIFDKQTNSFRCERYYRFTHGNFYDSDEAALMEKLHQTHLDVFERFVLSVRGQTIVLPLSGGYDSRLIANMLKRFGHEKVITFTFGLKDSWQVRISKEVAANLGYQWIFIEYSASDWSKWYQSDARKEYARYAAGLNSIGQLNDWPAVSRLRDLNAIPSDAIFVPGHAEDFIAGSHIPACFMMKREISQEVVISEILKKHYSLWRLQNCSSRMQRLFRSRITGIIGDEPTYTSEEAANAFELWDWQERQAKFITNAVRVYEYWGYQWRLPLWDAQLADFWSRIPVRFRLNRQLYIDCSHRYEQVGAPQPNPRTLNELRTYFTKKFPRTMALVEALNHERAMLAYYYSYELGTTRIISFPKFLQYRMQGLSDVYSILAKLYLEELGQSADIERIE